MPIADRWVPGAESGVSPLLLIGGAMALAVVVVLLIMMLRRRNSGLALSPVRSEVSVSSAKPDVRSGSALAWPMAFVIGCLFVAWGIAVRPPSGMDGNARLSLDARVAELTMRALAPNSPLACLEAAGSPAIEAACEKILFSSPETLAAAAAYVDAKLNLFVEGNEAGRNSGAGDAFERLRRTVEADRYGLVAHVLTTRGCNADNCPTLKLLRDSTQVANNLKDRTFDANVALHSGSWRGDVPVASAPVTAPSLASAPIPSASTSTAPAAPTPSSPSKFEFPSSASIPAVSIMSAEPSSPPAPKGAEQPAQPAPAARPAASRRQSARERETTSQSQGAQVGAPVQIAPPHEAPAPAGTLANPGPAR